MTYSSELSSSPASSDFSDDAITLASSRPKRRAGRKVFKETRHPVYRGVRMRNNNKWVCELREPKKKTRIWLGTYPTAEMAARAHDVAALALRGRKACLNFADSVWRLPIPRSADAADIRKAAVEAAEEFRPRGINKSVDLSGERKGSIREEDDDEKVVMYVDDEAVFGLPLLLTSMAEGLLLSPPHYTETGFIWEHQDEQALDYDMSLWTFSI